MIELATTVYYEELICVLQIRWSSPERFVINFLKKLCHDPFHSRKCQYFIAYLVFSKFVYYATIINY